MIDFSVEVLLDVGGVVGGLFWNYGRIRSSSDAPLHRWKISAEQ